MLCRDLMTPDVVTCRVDDTVEWCARLMRDFKIGFLPVVDPSKRVVGVVTDRDLVLRAVAENKPHATEARAIMTPSPLSCHLNDPLQIAEDKMSAERKSRVVVVDSDGRCLGVISIADIAQSETRRRAGEVLEQVTKRECSPKRTTWNSF